MFSKYKTAKELTALLSSIPPENHENLIASFLNIAYEAGKDEGYKSGREAGWRACESDRDWHDL